MKELLCRLFQRLASNQNNLGSDKVAVDGLESDNVYPPQFLSLSASERRCLGQESELYIGETHARRDLGSLALLSP